MKFKELKSKPTAELKRILSESREQLRDLRFKVASNQLKNIREIRQLKKTIAQISFVLHQTKNQETKNQETKNQEKKDN